MKDRPTIETLLRNLRNAPREPYDPELDYEPPYNPEWARAANELQYVTNARYQDWMDARLADLRSAVEKWKEAGETKLWTSAQATLDRYAELRALVRKEGTE